MDFKELLDFIDLEDQRLIDKDNSLSIKERVFGRTIKLAEELGELCNEILASYNDQRKEKLEKNKGNLSDEFADVIITALLLSKLMNIDIGNAITGKIDKINKRHEGK